MVTSIPFYHLSERIVFLRSYTEPPNSLRGNAEFSGQDFPYHLSLRYFHRKPIQGEKMAQIFTKH